MPSSRGHDHVTPAKLSAWEQSRFPALRRLAERARSTPVDDALPDDPWLHMDETRAALRRLGPPRPKS